MKINRRTTVGMLAAIAASPRLAEAQTPAPQRADSVQELESARDDLRQLARRIAAIPLPRTVEPAFHFRA